MSDFYARKVRTCFIRHDLDKDGFVTRKDFENIADRFVASGNLDEDRNAEVHAQMTKIWETYFRDPNSSQPIDEAGCVALFRNQYVDPDQRDTLGKIVGSAFEILFAAIDTNADKYIQLNEYENFFVNIGIDKVHAEASFQALDTNTDGVISLDEFVAAGVKFFLSDEENIPENLFWGPLV